MFDPEKVERWTDWEYWLSEEELGSMEAVKASDYDQLLELYREVTKKFREEMVYHLVVEHFPPA